MSVRLLAEVSSPDGATALGVCDLTACSVIEESNSIGSFTLSALPGSEALLMPGNRARIWSWPEHDARQELANGFLLTEQRVYSAQDNRLSLTGIGLTSELKRAFIPELVLNGLSVGAALERVIDFAPGWSVEPHTTRALPDMAFRYTNALAIITQIAELAGLVFWEVAHTLFFAEPRARNNGNVPLLHDGLTRLTQISLDSDISTVANAITPLFTHNNFTLTLEGATLNSPYPVRRSVINQHETWYIIDEESVERYGLLHDTLETDSLPAISGITNQANTLYLLAAQHLAQHSRPQEAWSATMRSRPDGLVVGGSALLERPDGGTDEFYIQRIETRHVADNSEWTAELVSNTMPRRSAANLLADNLARRKIIPAGNIHVENVSAGATLVLNQNTANLPQENELGRASTSLGATWSSAGSQNFQLAFRAMGDTWFLLSGLTWDVEGLRLHTTGSQTTPTELIFADETLVVHLFCNGVVESLALTLDALQDDGTLLWKLPLRQHELADQRYRKAGAFRRIVPSSGSQQGQYLGHDLALDGAASNAPHNLAPFLGGSLRIAPNGTATLTQADSEHLGDLSDSGVKFGYLRTLRGQGLSLYLFLNRDGRVVEVPMPDSGFTTNTTFQAANALSLTAMLQNEEQLDGEIAIAAAGATTPFVSLRPPQWQQHDTLLVVVSRGALDSQPAVNSGILDLELPPDTISVQYATLTLERDAIDGPGLVNLTVNNREAGTVLASGELREVVNIRKQLAGSPGTQSVALTASQGKGVLKVRADASVLVSAPYAN